MHPLSFVHRPDSAADIALCKQQKRKEHPVTLLNSTALFPADERTIKPLNRSTQNLRQGNNAKSCSISHWCPLPLCIVPGPQRTSTDLCSRVQWPVSAQGKTATPSGNSHITRTTPSTAVISSSNEPQLVLSEPVNSILRSKVSQHNAFVQFVSQHNAFVPFVNHPYTVRLMWVSFQGEEVAHDELRPGGRCIQHSFATHPWIAREVSTATQLHINMQEAFCAKQATRRILSAAPALPAAVVAAAAAEAAARAGAPVAVAQLCMAAEALQNAFTAAIAGACWGAPACAKTRTPSGLH